MRSKWLPQGTCFSFLNIPPIFSRYLRLLSLIHEYQAHWSIYYLCDTAFLIKFDYKISKQHLNSWYSTCPEPILQNVIAFFCSQSTASQQYFLDSQTFMIESMDTQGLNVHLIFQTKQQITELHHYPLANFHVVKGFSCQSTTLKHKQTN